MDASEATRLAELALSKLHRFEALGRLEDIEEAIITQRKVLNLTVHDAQERPAQLNALGTLLTVQFQRTSDLDSLGAAISAQEEAVKLTPSGHPDLPIWLNSLGHSLMLRSKMADSDGVYSYRGDIDRAIENLTQAVDILPPTHSSLPSCLINLGLAKLQREEKASTPSLEQLTDATSELERAISMLGANDVQLAEAHHVLGSIQAHLFMLGSNEVTIQSAISNQRSAISLTPNTHPRLSVYLRSLGMALERLSSTDIDELSSDEALYGSLSCFQEGALSTTGSPSVRLQNAMMWAIGALIPRGSGDPLCESDEALEAFDTVVELLPVVAGLDRTAERRHQIISEYPNLVSAAVGTAFGCGDLERALRWMEQGRCLVWNQLNELRTPVDDLRAMHPDLADRVQAVSASLEHMSSRSGSSSSMLEDESYRHVKVANEWKDLLEEVRAKPGFTDFLRPPTVAALLDNLPDSGAVTVINVDGMRSDALVLQRGQDLIHVRLPESTYFDAEKWNRRLKNARVSVGIRGEHGVENEAGEMSSEEGETRAARPYPRAKRRASIEVSSVLGEMWTNIVKPIFDGMGLSSSEHPSNRLWWCATGPLAFLPLHAAGMYDGSADSQTTVFDYAIPSYTPNVTSLVEAWKQKRSIASSPPTILVVSEPSAPGFQRIAGTIKEARTIERIAAVKEVPFSVLEGEEATVGVTLEASKDYSIAHFACHASQNSREPLKSAFHLHDGNLELSTLVQRNLRTRRSLDLAFLSACQTSTGDQRLSEEAVHLAAGMIAAGYRGVVGTMWSIQDQYAPDVAEDFYDRLLQRRDGKVGDGEVDLAEAASALRYAVRRLAERLDRTDASFVAWVPYVHYGL